MFDVKNKTAIVTGAAGGFGKEFADRLLKRGAKVCVVDYNEALGSATVKELAKRYGEKNVIFVKCDVSQEDSWKSLWEETETKLGPVTLLCNNAGVHPGHGWKRCLDIMLYGVCHGAYLALDKMGTSKGGPGGFIINTASLAGYLHGLTGPEGAGYEMSKHGVTALTRCFQMGPYKDNSFVKDGVKMVSLCPWFADTQLVRDISPIDSLEKKTKNRVLTPVEVADVFEKVLDLHEHGKLYGIFPDANVMDLASTNIPVFAAYCVLGKLMTKAGYPDVVIRPLHLYATIAIAIYLAVWIGLFILGVIF